MSILPAIPIPISETHSLKIENAAQWLCPADRDAFRNAVADELRGHELGVVTRAIARAFGRFFRPLQLPAPERHDRPGKLKEDGPIAPKRKHVAARQIFSGGERREFFWA